MRAPSAAPVALAPLVNLSGEFASARRRGWFGGRTRPLERTLELLHRQELKRCPRSVRGANRHDLKAGLSIYRSAARDVADDGELKENLPARHAAVLRSNLAQTAVSASMSRSINASSWNGDGVNRRRSVPRGTVGKLIGWA
jgi:hypothetical protein